MACCKAEKSEWCKGLATVYTKEEEKEYCIFHAPKGQKGVATVEEFNNLVFKRISEARDSKKVCDLSGTIFEGPIYFKQFDRKNPLPPIDLRWATFTEQANFEGTTFSGSAYFSNTTFSGRALFGDANFRGGSTFRGATFSGEANFGQAIFSGGAYFSGTTFSEKALFWDTIFREEANFEGTTFSGGAYFSGTIFSGEATFWAATFSGETTFRDATFSGKANFLGSLVAGTLHFIEVDLSHVSFLETNLRNFQFVRCTWLRKLGRNVLYDEIGAKRAKKARRAYEQTEDLYRQLKQKYKEEHNEPEASNWHYGEKEMFRKKRWWRRLNPLSFSNLYRASSGYGESPIRAGIMLLLLVVIVTISMNFFGLIPLVDGKSVYGVTEIKGFSGLVDWKKFWLIVYSTIQHALFFKTPFFKPATLIGEIFLTVFTKLLIPVQAALFTLALRNKFRR